MGKAEINIGIKKNKNIFIPFFLVSVLFNMGANFTHPVTPVIFKRLMLDDYMFGLALACMMFTNFLFSPFWGKISEFISTRNTLLIGCVGYGIGQLFFALSQNQTQIILARIFAGMFTGGAFVSLLTYISNNAPDEKTRGSYLVTSATIQAVAGSVGYFIGGMLGEIHIYAAVFAQVATLCLCGVLFRIVCVDDSKNKDKSNGKIEIKTLVKQANPFSAFAAGRVLLTAFLAPLFVISVLQALGQTAFDQSFNYYLVDRLGFSSGNNGVVKFIMGIATLIANSTICTWLMRKTNSAKTGPIALLTAVLFLFSGLWISSLVPYLIVNILFYASNAICIPIYQSLIAKEGKKTPEGGMVMAFYNSLRSLGSIFGALIAGFSYVINPKMPFVFCVVSLLIAVAFAFFYGYGKKADSVKEK